MTPPRFTVTNRPKHAAVIPAALYGFLGAATLTGGFVGAVIADRARVWRNTRRLERGTR